MMHLANEGALEMHQLSCQTAQLQVHKHHSGFDLNEYLSSKFFSAQAFLMK